MYKITVIGLGCGGDLTLNSVKIIKGAKKVLVKTELAKSFSDIKEYLGEYESLDKIYEKSCNFDTLNKNLADYVLKCAKLTDVVYLVDGSAQEDNSVKLLSEKCDIELIGGVSKCTKAMERAGVFAESYSCFSAYDLDKITAEVLPIIIYDIDSPILAGEVKLKLLDLIGEERVIFFVGEGVKKEIPVYELDRQKTYDYSTAVVIKEVDVLRKERFNYSDLMEILTRLRSENGCPWDREQTQLSVLKPMLEETYEFIDAVRTENEDGIIEELGDVFLQTAFQLLFGKEENRYTSSDVLTGICKKLISRHTHVFGKDKAVDGESALAVWEKNKAVEKEYSSGGEYLSSVPKSFPAAMRAQKVCKRAAKYNFDFEEVEQIFSKIVEEMGEVRAEIQSGNSDLLKKELGDLLFASVNLARFLGFEAEECLNLTTEKFISRFTKLEEAILKDGKDMKNMTLEELDKYYNAAKKSENR